MNLYIKILTIAIILCTPIRIPNESKFPQESSFELPTSEKCYRSLEVDPFSESFKGYLRWLEVKYDLPEGLLFILMMKESSGRIYAISPVGAQGLFQFMPNTSSWLEVDPFDPHQSAAGAARYLQFLINHFGGSLELGLAAYNAGMGNVRKYGNQIPPFQETQQYVAYITHKIDF